jgi:hypothetical protein
MTEHHLAQARQIMEQLENSGGATAAAGARGAEAGQAQRPGTQTPPRR